jgi:outer membrane lipoprotein carrier protein
VNIADIARRALTLSLVLSTPVLAWAYTPRTQRSAQTRPRADAGVAPRRDAGAATRTDASAPRPNATDAGVAPSRADAAVVVAPPPGSATPNRALNAAQIVAGVQAFYNRTTDFASDFRQFNTTAATNTTTESRGRVQIRRPGRMRWDYTQPPGNLVVSDGTQLWTYEPASRQAFLANLAQSQLPAALSFLMGTGNLASNFAPSLRTTTARGYENFYMLELTPLTPNPSFARLVLFVTPQDYQVAEAAIVDAQNNRNRFQFVAGTVRVNTNPPPETFRWTPPQGTNVIRP